MICLDTPLFLSNLALKNRVVMAPMTRNKSPYHIPNQEVANYYAKRADGDVGLIITEGTCVGHIASHAYPNVPSFYGKQALAGWALVVNEVHKKGGKIFPQLWHTGSIRQSSFHVVEGIDNPSKESCSHFKIPGYGPSSIIHPYIQNGEIPREMSVKDIEDVIASFAKAAKDAKALGFDGIEIHAAHGYLIDQFFWEVTNKRIDVYGGKTLKERTRFACEIIQACREAVGKDFPIDLRISQWKMGDYNHKMAKTPKELEAFLAPLVLAGVDMFHCSTRRFYEPEFESSHLNLAGWVKKLSGKPTITVGSIGLDQDFVTTFGSKNATHLMLEKMKQLQEGLNNQEYDLVAIGRSLLADPNWFEKFSEGRHNQIIPFTKQALEKLN
jgi:2,4-dienoyl-CoA reductase-like NADH-dependent reductase (Old Yellow Enzyme family)